MFTKSALAEALTDRRLDLIILPTEKCDFRCTYCCEDFAQGKMAAKLVTGIKKLIDSRIDDVQHITLAWFGGEPLLAKDIVLGLGRYAHDACESRGVGFSGALTTNAYTLDTSLLRRLIEINHQNYQVTLDGDRDWHDKTRILANHRGSFDKIWSNLISYKNIQGNYSISLRLHLHKENIESMRRLYSKVHSEFGADKRFSTFFHKVSNLRGERGIPQQELSRSEYNRALEYVTGEKLSGLSADVNLSDYICYAAKPNSLMIRADGRIGKCTVALDDPRNDIGRLLDDGTLDINNEIARLWFHGYEDFSTQSLGCPYSTLPSMAKEKTKWLGSTQVQLA